MNKPQRQWFRVKKKERPSLASVALTALRRKRGLAEAQLIAREEEIQEAEGWFGTKGYDFKIFKDGNEETVRYDRNSIGIFKGSSKLRQAVVNFTEWIWFERVVTAIIIANSIQLCFQDNKVRLYGQSYQSPINEQLERIDYIFTTLFTLEAMFQIIAKGFVFHKNAYLRNHWNILDLFVVVVSIINYMPIKLGSLKFLRTFRVLRPLRTIKRLPKMRRLIGTLAYAVRGLSGVVFFIAFIVYLFAIFGLNSFQGTQYRFCRSTLEPIIERDDRGELISFHWPIESNFSWLCHFDSDCKNFIDIFGTDQVLSPGETPVYKCGESFQPYGVKAGGKLDIDDVRKNARIFWDFTNFNNIPNSMLTIFQVLTLENWVDPIMYQYMSANQMYLTAIYFLGLVMLGAFFMMNLFLAQMIFSFDKQTDDDTIKDTNESENSQSQEESANDLAPENEVKIGTTMMARQNNHKVIDLNVLASPMPMDESALIDENPDETAARQRSHKNKCFRTFYRLSTFWGFNFFITIAIFLNTACLALDTFDQSELKERFLSNADIVFTWLFCCEAIAKIIGLGPKCYMRDYYNVFDACVVILSLIDFTITLTLSGKIEQNTAILNAFRSLRLLRIIKPIKLARRWRTLHEILGKTMNSMRALIDFMLLLGLFMFIFSLLGMQLFGNQSYQDMDQQIVLKEDLPERNRNEVLRPIPQSFDNILISINTVYRIMTGEGQGWSYIMYQNLRPLGEKWGFQSLYFVLTRAFGNQVMLSLLTAILCNSFSGQEVDEDEEAEENKEKGKKKKIFSETFERIVDEFLYFFGFRLTVAEAKRRSLPQRAKSEPALHVFSPDQPSEREGENSDVKSDSIISNNSQLLQTPNIIFMPRAATPAFIQEASPSRVNPAQVIDESKIQTREIRGLPLVNAEGLPAFHYSESQQRKSAQGPALEDRDLFASIASSPEQLPAPLPPSQDNRESDNQQQAAPIVTDQNMHSNESMPRRTRRLSASEQPKRDNSFASIKKQSRFNNTMIEVAKPLDEPVNTEQKLKGYSLFVLSPKNWLRLKLLGIISHSKFETVVLILIAISTLLLAFENPLDKPNSLKLAVLRKIDYFMTSCFTLEMIMKIVTYGFLLNGSNSYLRSIWNVLDFVVVSAALISLYPGTASLRSLRSLRTIRVLRPLRMVQRHKGLKVAMLSLFKSLPQILNLQIIELFVLSLFGIFFKTLFGGMFWYCSTEHLRANGQLSDQQLSEVVATKWDCINYGGEWVNTDFKFDNFQDSMLALAEIRYEMFSWLGIDQQPREWSKQYLIVLAILVDIIVNLLFMNLFISIVYETFKGQKTQLSSTTQIQRSKVDWINMQILGYEAKPQKQTVTSDEYSTIRNFCIRLTSHPYFGQFMNGCIVGNTILLCISWYGMDKRVTQITDILNVIFIWIFTTSVVLKLIAFRLLFFYNSWNLFDLFVVSTSQIIVLLNWYSKGNKGIKTVIVRSLRIGRMIKIIKNIKQVNIIFHTLFEAAPSIASLGSLLLLVIFMYSIIGMRIFGFANVTEQMSINYYSNFKNFFNAFFLLLRSATGESHQIMKDFSRTKTILFQCEENQTINDILANGMVTNNCINPQMSFIFFESFQIIVAQIFINLFIAILVDSFIGQTQAGELPVGDETIEKFQKIWGQMDANATGKLRCKQMDELIKRLAKANSPLIPKLIQEQQQDQPISKQEKYERKKVIERFLAELEIKLFYDWSQDTVSDYPSVTFYEVLNAMLRHKFQKHFHTRALSLELINTVIGMFDYKDNFNDHKGGLQYEDRRIEILRENKAQVDKEIKRIKNQGDGNKELNKVFKSEACINKQIKCYIAYKTLHETSQIKRQSPQRLAKDPNVEIDESKLLEFADFTKIYYGRVYNMLHFIAVRKISRLYNQIKKKRHSDKIFQMERLEMIKKRQSSPSLTQVQRAEKSLELHQQPSAIPIVQDMLQSEDANGVGLHLIRTNTKLRLPPIERRNMAFAQLELPNIEQLMSEPISAWPLDEDSSASVDQTPVLSSEYNYQLANFNYSSMSELAEVDDSANWPIDFDRFEVRNHTQ